jgi:hypothetical protein
VLLLNGVGYLSGPTEEVEVLANRSTACTGVASEGIIVEVIAGFVKLVAETIIGVFKIDCVSGTFMVTREAGERIVRLREARRRLVVSLGIKAKE